MQGLRSAGLLNVTGRASPLILHGHHRQHVISPTAASKAGPCFSAALSCLHRFVVSSRAPGASAVVCSSINGTDGGALSSGGSSGRILKPSIFSATGQATFLLVLINVIVFLADHVAHLPMQSLYLLHSKPQWYQWITHQFCHGSFQHLSSNLFHLLVFGKMVEETEGSWGLVFVYLLCGAGAAFASWLATPGANTYSVGASGAIFGLFAVSVLARISWRLQPLLEAAILGQFVVGQVSQELKSQVAGGLMLGGMQVSHMAHLGGALAGVLLVLLLSKVGGDEPATAAMTAK